MINFLGKPRFNHIDLITAISFAYLHGWVAWSILIIGVILSSIFEMLYKGKI